MRAIIVIALTGLAATALTAPGAAQTEADTADAERTAVRALQRPGDPAATEVVETRQVGPTLWMVVADRAGRGDDSHELNACMVVGREGLRRATCIVLPTPGASTGFAAESSSVEELAHDRRAYFAVWINYQGAFARPGVGTDFHRLFVLTADPAPRLSLALEVSRTNDVTHEAMSTELAWRDVDGDRHPDVVIQETVCRDDGGGPQCQPPVTHTYLWTRASRRWVLRGR